MIKNYRNRLDFEQSIYKLTYKIWIQKMKIIVITFYIMLLALVGTVKAEGILTAIQDRNGIAYLPNSDTPFTGEYELSHQNGQKKSKTTYKDGKKDGLVTYWYENGQKQDEATFKDGKEDGLYTMWYVNGQKAVEVTFKNGKREGLSTVWYENGQKKYELTFKNGDKNGVSPEWDENGQKTGETTYKDDKPL